MNANFETEHFRGYAHDGRIHVVYKGTAGTGEYEMGAFTDDELRDLNDLRLQWSGTEFLGGGHLPAGNAIVQLSVGEHVWTAADVAND